MRPATRGGGQAEVELAPVVPGAASKMMKILRMGIVTMKIMMIDQHDDQQLAPVVPGTGNIVMRIIMVRIVVMRREGGDNEFNHSDKGG